MQGRIFLWMNSLSPTLPQMVLKPRTIWNLNASEEESSLIRHRWLSNRGEKRQQNPNYVLSPTCITPSLRLHTILALSRLRNSHTEDNHSLSLLVAIRGLRDMWSYNKRVLGKRVLHTLPETAFSGLPPGSQK